MPYYCVPIDEKNLIELFKNEEIVIGIGGVIGGGAIRDYLRIEKIDEGKRKKIIEILQN